MINCFTVLFISSTEETALLQKYLANEGVNSRYFYLLEDYLLKVFAPASSPKLGQRIEYFNMVEVNDCLPKEGVVLAFSSMNIFQFYIADRIVTREKLSGYLGQGSDLTQPKLVSVLSKFGIVRQPELIKADVNYN
jgi:hypothetical protein